MAGMSDVILFAEERRNKILEYILEHKKATVTQLCGIFKVSIATIRNDLRELENNTLLTRTHGGAIVRSRTKDELDLNQRRVQNVQEKQRIAVSALNLVEDGDTIILDGGTTVTELAKILKRKINLTVITNDLGVALIVEDMPVNLILLGGIVRNNFHCALGAAGIKMLSEVSADKVFFGANCFSVEKGATVPDMLLAETKKAMIASAAKVFILCDSSKFGKNSLAQFATLSQIDVLVTDQISDSMKEKLEENDIDVVIAS
jgi:DeoR family fructose operon transcriptional repressor